MLVIVLLLLFLITLKGNKEFREVFYNKVIKDNFSFAKIDNWYEKTFGNIVTKEKTNTVSSDTIEYSKKEKYQKGVKLTLKDNYSIPFISNGLIIFAGDKENYGKTVVLQKPDETEVWYTNLKTINVKLYDYIKAGDIVGDADNNILNLYFVKNNEFLDYNKYL